MTLQIFKKAIDHGAIGAFIQGGIADKVIFEKNTDYLRKPIEFIQELGLIAVLQHTRSEFPRPVWKMVLNLISL
jgi:hypothetical protein